jgi:hypothetical protein
MRRLVTFLMVLSLLVVGMPSVAVFASEEGSSSGSFTVGGEVPQVIAFETYFGCRAARRLLPILRRS